MKTIKKILLRLTSKYESIIDILHKERECLIKIDNSKLIEILKTKQKMVDEIRNDQEDLKKFLKEHKVENISEFLLLESKNNYADDIHILNNKLKEKLMDFRIKEEVNRMIAQEHLQFFSGLLNIYAAILSNENYDKNALTNINAHVMNLRA